MKSFTDTQIGLAVKTARLAAGWPAKQLAECSGLLPTALSKIESGKQTLGFAQAHSICSALGIRLDHLSALVDELPDQAMEAAVLREKFKSELKRLEKMAIHTAIGVQSKQEEPSAANS